MPVDGPSSKLARKLGDGAFVVTAEIAPPRGVDVGPSLALARALAPLVDAFNITDNQNARLRLASLAFSHLMVAEGHEVIFQLTCRDRNRLALQSDLLGAWALGIRNILALTGDHVTMGDHPEAAPVFDLDAIQLLAVISGLNDGRDMSGHELKGAPLFFAGAALACDQKPLELALLRFGKKMDAGACFFQTQAVFDPASLKPFMAGAEGRDVHILAGVLLLHSAGMIDYINQKVPGLAIPPDVAGRVKSAADPVEAGFEEAARIIRECRGLCHGVHLMTAGRDDLLPELLRRAGPA